MNIFVIHIMREVILCAQQVCVNVFVQALMDHPFGYVGRVLVANRFYAGINGHLPSVWVLQGPD